MGPPLALNKIYIVDYKNHYIPPSALLMTDFVPGINLAHLSLKVMKLTTTVSPAEEQ